jgi:hypothetical protein
MATPLPRFFVGFALGFPAHLNDLGQVMQWRFLTYPPPPGEGEETARFIC